MRPDWGRSSDSLNVDDVIWTVYSETMCTVSYDSKSNCVTFSGTSDDVQTAEKRFTKKCLDALHRDTFTVSQAGTIHHSCLSRRLSKLLDFA